MGHVGASERLDTGLQPVAWIQAGARLSGPAARALSRRKLARVFGPCHRERRALASAGALPGAGAAISRSHGGRFLSVKMPSQSCRGEGEGGLAGWQDCPTPPAGSKVRAGRPGGTPASAPTAPSRLARSLDAPRSLPLLSLPTPYLTPGPGRVADGGESRRAAVQASGTCILICAMVGQLASGCQAQHPLAPQTGESRCCR